MSDLWGNVAAAIGGGLQGGYGAYQWQQQEADKKRKDEMQAQLLQLRNDIAHLQEEGKNTRSADTNKTKKEIADEERTRKTDETTGKLDYMWDTSARMWDQGQQRIDTTRRGQDLGLAGRQYTADSAAGVGYDRNDTTRRGQDVGAATSRYRTDATVGAADRRTMAGAVTSSNAQRMRAATFLANSMGRDKVASGDISPTDWAAEVDKFYNDPALAASSAAAIAAAQGQPATSAAGASPASPAPVTPPGSPAKPPVPMSPPRRPGAAAPVVTPKGTEPRKPEARARALIDQIRAADAAGQDSSALRKQLAALRAQVPQ